jgi:uncharacterized peroxidase-related enzyme
MPHIPLEEHLPGITGLLEYRRDTAEPIRALTDLLLRGPSTLTPAERELIAAVVSHGNGCEFCTTAHAAVADRLLGESKTCAAVLHDIDSAAVSDKMKALLHVAAAVRSSGRQVTPKLVDRARAAGATDRELHDTVLIAALFCLYNKYVDGLATALPADPAYYETMSARIADSYARPAHGYDHLKRETP